MQTITQQFVAVRQQFKTICAPLATEDYSLQAIPETSPAKWHLAHTSWFFETFILKPFAPEYAPWNDQFEVLFNSYYNGVGKQFPRPERHLLSRPTVDEIYDYRDYVDTHMLKLLATDNHVEIDEIRQRTVLGINHEQQHQELFFTDLKYCLFQNPLYPPYQETPNNHATKDDSDTQWLAQEGGLCVIGLSATKDEEVSFCFDNETPTHNVYLQSYEIADRLVTNADYMAFIEDGGYQNSQLWLADGWAEVNSNQWTAPLYWVKKQSQWYQYTLAGLQPVSVEQPVCHVSYYEADAFARWAGARLPTEQEWENAVASVDSPGQFIESANLQPGIKIKGDEQFFGHVWQWTSSAYQPYPGFHPVEGAIGEYNGKFMCNQQVLRGGSYVTPRDHFRKSYRNFFYPRDRWQFSGIRLAK